MARDMPRSIFADADELLRGCAQHSITTDVAALTVKFCSRPSQPRHRAFRLATFIIMRPFDRTRRGIIGAISHASFTDFALDHVPPQDKASSPLRSHNCAPSFGFRCLCRPHGGGSVRETVTTTTTTALARPLDDIIK